MGFETGSGEQLTVGKMRGRFPAGILIFGREKINN